MLINFRIPIQQNFIGYKKIHFFVDFKIPFQKNIQNFITLQEYVNQF